MEAAIERAMMIVPGDRFAKAGELNAALTRQPPMRRRLKRYRLPAAMAAGVLAVVVPGFTLFRQKETRLVPGRVLVGPLPNRTGDKSLKELGELAGDYRALCLADAR